MQHYSHIHSHQPVQIQASTTLQSRSWQSGLKLLAIASIGLLSACAQSTPYYDSKFGEATRATLNMQIANPDAGNNTDPVTGLDGRAARDVIDNYQKSFAKPEKPQNVFNIGVGAGGN